MRLGALTDVRIELIHRDGSTIVLNDAAMVAPQLSRFEYTAGMRDGTDLLAQSLAIALHTFCLVFGNETTL